VLKYKSDFDQVCIVLWANVTDINQLIISLLSEKMTTSKSIQIALRDLLQQQPPSV